MNIDIFKLANKVGQPQLRQKVLEFAFNWVIPFNKGLGLKLIEVSPEQVSVRSRPIRRRQNHVGGAHACFLALMGEYAAGLCLAQNFSIVENRMIIGSLKMTYLKQGRGVLTSVAKRPAKLPKAGKEAFFVPVVTEIFNEKNEVVAICETDWQIKKWDQVRK